MDDILPGDLIEWEPGDDGYLTEDTLDGGDSLVEDGSEGTVDSGELLDGGGDDGDGGLIDGSGIDGEELPGDGDLLDDEGLIGGDEFVWDGDIGAEGIMVVDGISWGPWNSEDFVFDDGGTAGLCDPPSEGGDAQEIYAAISWMPCFPVDAII